MPLKINPTNGQLELVPNNNFITGVPPTTVGAIAVWNDLTATTLINSRTNVQASGAIEAQAFLADRQILNDIVVPTHYTMFQTDVYLISGDIILDGDSTLLLL